MSPDGQRILVAAVGSLAALVSTMVPWLHVDLGDARGAATDLVEERLDISVEDGVAAGVDAVEEATGRDLAPLVELVEGAERIADAVERSIPNGLLTAIDGGRSAHEIFGLGLGLSVVAVVGGLMTGLAIRRSSDVLRVCGFACEALLCAAAVGFAAVVYLLEPVALWLLPQDWEPFRPRLGVGIGPGLMLVGGAGVAWSGLGNLFAVKDPQLAKTAVPPASINGAGFATPDSDAQDTGNPWL